MRMSFILSKRRVARAVFLSLATLVVSGCQPPEKRELARAQATAARGHFRTSLTYFENVLLRAPTSPSALAAAREGTKISLLDLKDHKKAIEFSRHLVHYSPDPEERISAQKQIASLYFDHLQDYGRAVIEYGRLMSMPTAHSDRPAFQLAIARSNYYLGKFDQAESEMERLLAEKLDPPNRFSALMLWGNVLVARKNFSKAVEVYKTTMREFPDRSRDENVGLSLALCYEENGDYRNSVAVLEGLRGSYSPPEYIDFRIKRLKERQKNQPGAKGLGRK